MEVGNEGQGKRFEILRTLSMSDRLSEGNEINMAIIIHPHALQRMEERGTTSEEVLRTIKAGRISPARFGRQRYGRTFSYGDLWRAQFYEHKHVEAYCVVDGEDIIVVTVVVKYF